MKRILVQAGHNQPLQPEFRTSTGTKGEAELTRDIQRALVRRLKRDEDFHPVPVPGHIPKGIQVNAAIYLHADGNDNTSARGFSLGFPSFAINRRLANLIAEEFEKLPGHPQRRSDNNTPDMAKYYGFNLVDTPGPEVLVEHGFLTNPQENRWLQRHVDALARAEHRALRRFFGLKVRPAGKKPARQDPSATPAKGRTVSPNSRLRAAKRAPAERAVDYMLARPHGEYLDDEVQAIVGHYYKTAGAVGLDPLLVIAQMALETGHLTSFWSQRPRRNPAGIGVTGEPGVGLSFPDWKTAVRAHTGRLLAYATPSAAGNQSRQRLIQEALAFRPLPEALRGVAPTLKGLAGNWAADPQYAVKLARVANDIRTHRS